MGDAREVGPTSVAGPEPPLTTTTTGGNGNAFQLNQLIPHSDFIAKAYQLPVVSQPIGYATTMYGWGKNHNAIMYGLLTAVEKTVIVSLVLANKIAARSGIADKLSGPLHIADESACRVLDRVEQALPVITTIEPQVYVDATVQRVRAYQQVVNDRVEAAKRVSQERVGNVKHTATEKVQHAMETPQAGAVNKTVARGLKSADQLIDLYLPAVAGVGDQTDSAAQKSDVADTTIGMPNGSTGNGHVNGGSVYYDSSDGFRHNLVLAREVAAKLGQRVNVRAQRQQKLLNYYLIEMPASTLQVMLEQLSQRGYQVRQRVNDYVIEGSERLGPKVQFMVQPVRNGLQKATTVVLTYVPPEAVERVRRFSEAAQSIIGVSIFPQGWNLSSISTVSLSDLHSEPLISHDDEDLVNFNNNDAAYHASADEEDQADDGVVFDDNASEETLHGNGQSDASAANNDHENFFIPSNEQQNVQKTTTTTTTIEYSKVSFASPSDDASSSMSPVSAELEVNSVDGSNSTEYCSASSSICSSNTNNEQQQN